MSAYFSLAPHYDALTTDVPYEKFADFYEKIFCRYGISPQLVLDLACGTGTLTGIMAARGYEMIGVDSSEEMLSIAIEKSAETPCRFRPIFLCQNMEQLDLFGTVSAAICSLDGMNYLPSDILETVFERLRLFIEPGGLLIFDINTPEKLKSLDGETFIDETDDVFCVWRTEFDLKENKCCYGIDIFVNNKDVWLRDFEEHIEYAHSIQDLEEKLIGNGFGEISVFGELNMLPPEDGEKRVFIAAKRL